MARAIWNGSLSFGLVQIPVRLYGAEQRDELSLSLLDRHDLAPVGFDRVNRRTGEKVDWKDVVKGYAYQKGKYVVVTDEDIRNANVRATQTIDILAFVDREEISSLYYDTPYYLAPAKQGAKAYAILRDTLRETRKVGIAKVVIRTRQHLASLIVEGDMLVLQLLRFAHELRGIDALDIKKEDVKPAKATPREVEMAKQLVASMVEPWNPEQYHDEYRDDLLARIKRKAQHGEIEDVPASDAKRAPSHGKVVDLVELLKQSVEKSQDGRGAHAKAGPHLKKAAANGRSASKAGSASSSRSTGSGRSKGGAHREHATRKAPSRKTA